MPGQRPILAMSFVASLGITFHVLSCTLPRHESNFWPLLVYLFYVLLPVPMAISSHIVSVTAVGSDPKAATKARDYAIFFTVGIMVSTFALPILLSRGPVGHSVVSLSKSNNPLHFKSNWNWHLTECSNFKQIKPIQCTLVEFGNLLCFATVGLFHLYLKPVTGT